MSIKRRFELVQDRKNSVRPSYNERSIGSTTIAAFPNIPYIDDLCLSLISNDPSLYPNAHEQSRGAKIASREKDPRKISTRLIITSRERFVFYPISSLLSTFFLFPSTTTKYSDALRDCGSSHNALRDLFPSTFRPRFPISSF